MMDTTHFIKIKHKKKFKHKGTIKKLSKVSVRCRSGECLFGKFSVNDYEGNCDGVYFQ